MDELRAWCTDQIKHLTELIALIEKGTLRFHKQELGSPMIDTTDADLATAKTDLARMQQMVTAIDRKLGDA